MSFFSTVNYISAAMIVLFLLPLIAGLISPFSGQRMQRSIASLLNNITFLAALVMSLFLTTRILADTESTILLIIYKAIPPLQTFLSGQDIWVYIITALVLLVVLFLILYALTMPIYTYIFVPLTEKISSAARTMNGVARRVLGLIWELPKAAVYIFIFSLLLNFYIGFYNGSSPARYISQSMVYQLVDNAVIEPLLSTRFARQIPVIVKNSFDNAAATLEARNIRLIRYFNGVTLDEAIRSNDEIDATAHTIVGNETKDIRKARLIYNWLSQNIAYDYKKAENIFLNSSGISSGAVVTYDTRIGICFDYSTLYVAMCRAVDVKVRFVTGLGYGGSDWGDHSWNQIYSYEEDRWLNIDTTFGSSGMNYFDRSGFNDDHRNEVVQGEW